MPLVCIMATKAHPTASMRGGEWTLLDERTRTVQLLPTALTLSPRAVVVNALPAASSSADQKTAWTALHGTLAMCVAVADRLQQAALLDAESAAAAQHLAVLLHTAAAAAAQCQGNHAAQPASAASRGSADSEADTATLLAEKASLVSLVHELRDLVAQQRRALAAARSTPAAAAAAAAVAASLEAQPRDSGADVSTQSVLTLADLDSFRSDDDSGSAAAAAAAVAAAAATAATAAAATAALEVRCAASAARAEAAEQAAEVADRTRRVVDAKSARLEAASATAAARLATALAKAASLSRVVDTLESIVATQQGLLQAARPYHPRSPRGPRSSRAVVSPRSSRHDDDDEHGAGQADEAAEEGSARRRYPPLREGRADRHGSWERGAHRRGGGSGDDYGEGHDQDDHSTADGAALLRRRALDASDDDDDALDLSREAEGRMQIGIGALDDEGDEEDGSWREDREDRGFARSFVEYEEGLGGGRRFEEDEVSRSFDEKDSGGRFEDLHRGVREERRR